MHPVRVLIVDDSRMIRDVVAAMVQRLGHEPVCVADGAAALAADGCDLVLLDLNLPDRPGTEVARALCEQGVTAPIYGISGEDGVNDICRAAGMHGNLQKPIRLANLEAVLGLAHAERALGSSDLLRVMVEGLQEELPPLLEQAEGTDDVVELRRLAHTMRGALRYVEAPRAQAAVERLEESAKRGDIDRDALVELRETLDRLIPLLGELL